MSLFSLPEFPPFQHLGSKTRLGLFFSGSPGVVYSSSSVPPPPGAPGQPGPASLDNPAQASKEQTEPVDFSSSQQTPNFVATRGFEPAGPGFPRGSSSSPAEDSLARYRATNGECGRNFPEDQ